MKKLKYILASVFVLFFVLACVQDDDNTDFINTITAPTNVSALVTVTQDNSGLVTITATGEGATSFAINFGDNSENEVGIAVGENIEHIYEEGVYQATITASSLNGETTSINQEIVVSFEAPQNLVVTIENDPAISKQVNVTAFADFALSYELDFGETGIEPVMFNNDETVSHIYENAGIYTITVTAFSAAIQNTQYTEEFEVTAIVQPLNAAPNPPNRADADVISIFSSAYTNVPDTNYFPDWGQGGQGSGWAMFNLSGDEILQYINLSYQGIALADGTTIDVSGMEFLHLDVWTADVTTQIETSLINNPAGSSEAPVTSNLNENDWTSIEIPISDYTDQGLSVNEIFQLKFVGTPWAAGTVFIDNIYFYKAPSNAPEGLEGTWKMAPEAGSLGVGPSVGDISWYNCDAPCVTERACYFDDSYVFGASGSFSNDLGADTWLEGWQGAADGCGSPIAPHDGSNAATYVYNETAGTLTINGIGAYIGLPKANNAGELSNPADAPASITYNVTLTDINTMSVSIESGTGSGVFWQFKLIRENAVSPLAGSWQMAQEAGSLGVGPSIGDISWYNCDAPCVTERACYFDDAYVFGANGSFSNDLGVDTWLEGWQGAADGCGAPIAPHDGSNAASYVYDASAGTITVNGVGAYIGLPKANNAGELGNPADAPASIVYNVSFIDANTMSVTIESGTGSGVFWQYKLVRI